MLAEEFQKEFLHFSAELEIAPDDLLARGMIPPGARRKLIFEDCETLLARRGKFGRFRNALLRTLLSQLLWVLLRQSGVEENGAPKWLLDACAAMHREGELPRRFEAAGGALRPDAGAPEPHDAETFRHDAAWLSDQSSAGGGLSGVDSGEVRHHLRGVPGRICQSRRIPPGFPEKVSGLAPPDQGAGASLRKRRGVTGDAPGRAGERGQ